VINKATDSRKNIAKKWTWLEAASFILLIFIRQVESVLNHVVLGLMGAIVFKHGERKASLAHASAGIMKLPYTFTSLLGPDHPDQETAFQGSTSVD
jgi:hypothetical protein